MTPKSLFIEISPFFDISPYIEVSLYDEISPFNDISRRSQDGLYLEMEHEQGVDSSVFECILLHI